MWPATVVEETAPEHSPRDAHKGVLLVLLAAAGLATLVGLVGAFLLSNQPLLDTSLTLALATGILIGVVEAQVERAQGESVEERASGLLLVDEVTFGGGVTPTLPADSPDNLSSTQQLIIEPLTRLRAASVQAFRWLSTFRRPEALRVRVATLGLVGTGLLLLFPLPMRMPPLVVALVAATICVAGAGLAATAVHYLQTVSATRLPEAPALCEGARVLAWLFLVAALSVGLAWAGQAAILRTVHVALFLFNVALCYELLRAKAPKHSTVYAFPVDLNVISVLGSRTNPLASILDAGERQLGIDLRSTWALTVVRHSLEPLLIGLAMVGWLTTSLTVVGVDEEGLVERLGVPVGAPLMPGLHLHWPWPLDSVVRIPVLRAQELTVGHEGQESGGPENVLWAVEHAPNEYTLLLGNGRDLLTVDAGVQYRIADPRAWAYHAQNPADALKALAYRAVMRNTVNHTLDEVLSQNVVAATAQIRAMIQHDADALGLGVDIIGFTVGGMHPPVPVAPDYQAVVSAELGKVTAIVTAQAYRNQTVPGAESAALSGTNTAKAEGADARGRAIGEAWSFQALQTQYGAAPGEYVFRRRLETLEKTLAGRRFTVVDARFQRDGGELWVNPTP